MLWVNVLWRSLFHLLCIINDDFFVYSHNAFFVAALITFINVYIAYGIRSFRVKSTLDAKPAQHSYGYDKMILDVSKFVFAESALSVCIQRRIQTFDRFKVARPHRRVKFQFRFIWWMMIVIFLLHKLPLRQFSVYFHSFHPLLFSLLYHIYRHK